MEDVSLILYPAPDLDAAKRFFRKLTGIDPYVDSPYYVGYKNGSMEIGLVPGEKGAAAVPFWTVPDIAASVKALVDAGGKLTQEPTDVGQGLLVARLQDPNGAFVGLRQFPAKA